MSISSFSLFEAARRGIEANQTALNVVSQNISNASTAGYTRQEVIMKNTPPASYSTSMGTVGIGTGVEVAEIRQVRDSFIDGQIRMQNQIAGYWSTKENYLERIQTFIAENSDAGLKNLLDKFWKSTEDLANYPQSQATRQAMIEAGDALATGVRYMTTQLDGIKDSIGLEIEQKVREVNTLGRKIADINSSIIRLEKSDYKANDLRDERSRLMSDLSKLIKIDVGNSGRLDEAQVNINGHSFVIDEAFSEIELSYDAAGNPALKWKGEKDRFSSNPLAVTGTAGPNAAGGIYNVDIKSLASGFSIVSQAGAIDGDALIGKLGNVKNGTISLNGKEFRIDATSMSLNDIIRQINESGTQIKASIDLGGKLRLESKDTGEASKIKIGPATSNLLEVLGVEAAISGTPSPKITDANESLNIAGSFTINGRPVKIVQGQTDSLARIVAEINYNVPDVTASLVRENDNSLRVKIASKDGYSKITLADSKENLLLRLGLLKAPQTALTVAASSKTDGTDAKFVINNTEYSTASNLVTEAIPGATLTLAGAGKAQLDVRPAISGGELGALLETRERSIPDYINKMGEFIRVFASEVNRIHSEGFDLRGESGRNFFDAIEYGPSTPGAQILRQFAVNDEIKKDPSKVAAAGMDETVYAQSGRITSKGAGDNSAALSYIGIKTKKVFDDGSSVVDKYSEMMASIGDVLDTAQKTSSTQEIILKNMQLKKESVSGVSIDEEVSNMLKYQHAYNASARMVSVIDGLLNTIINGLVK